MKKLLVVVLVLGMASLANATLVITGGSGSAGVLEWSVDPVEDELIGTAAAVPSGAYAATVGLLGTYANNVDITPGRPGGTGMPTRVVTFGDPPSDYDVRNTGLGSIAWDPIYSSWALSAEDGPEPQLRAPGEWYVFDINLPIGTQFTAEFWGQDNDWAGPLGALELEVIPEPMTLALLGLGGLGLLRRRR
jgi:hypothetical protein